MKRSSPICWWRLRHDRPGDRSGELLDELDVSGTISTANRIACRANRRLAGAAIVGTRAYQQRVVQIGLALLGIAALLGITVAAAVTLGVVRPVRRLAGGYRSGRGGSSRYRCPDHDPRRDRQVDPIFQ